MATNQNKWVELVSKLNEQTQDGIIAWVPDGATSDPMIRYSHVIEAYKASYKDKGFRLIKISPQTLRFGGVFEPQVKSTFQLEIIDQDGKTLWKVPEVVGLKDLFESIKYQLSNVKQLIDDFLTDK